MSDQRISASRRMSPAGGHGNAEITRRLAIPLAQIAPEIAAWTAANDRAREAYDRHSQSTHRQEEVGEE